MAYLDNKTIIVDATLTKKGRELLATNGNLNITAFALADDEIDYGLYQPNHPQGTAYNDFALRNTPIFEAFFDETQLMKYKLVASVNIYQAQLPIRNIHRLELNISEF